MLFFFPSQLENINTAITKDNELELMKIQKTAHTHISMSAYVRDNP